MYLITIVLPTKEDIEFLDGSSSEDLDETSESTWFQAAYSRTRESIPSKATPCSSFLKFRAVIRGCWGLFENAILVVVFVTCKLICMGVYLWLFTLGA